jgi:hypothetical protein
VYSFTPLLRGHSVQLCSHASEEENKMKKIIILTAIMTMLLTASAFAEQYKCLCIGKKMTKICGNNLEIKSASMHTKKLGISEDDIMDYVRYSDVNMLKTEGIYYSSLTGWACASY